MGARVRYGLERGNTVPYPPLFDDIRHNHGFIDTRGRPDRIASIPEAQESEALASLLIMLAAPEAPLISLGCDLGQHEVPKARIRTRRVAGGYVQVISSRREAPEAEMAFFKRAGKRLEQGLVGGAGEDHWEINLCLAPVALKLEDEVDCQSIWIWFYAKASTHDRALASRERLLQVLSKVMSELSYD
ncbi:MAG TPA: hypothetical protein VI168_10620 [Croceibacterium sp.]